MIGNLEGISAQLRALAAAKNERFIDIAAGTGLTTRTVSAIMRGTGSPILGNVMAVAKYLGAELQVTLR